MELRLELRSNIGKKETKKGFYNELRKQEIEDFPEFTEENMYMPQHNSWVYFAPSWHLEHKLITKKFIDDVKKNGKYVLSVGSGPAYLERFLVNRLGICKHQITLSDKEPIMPENFDQFIFDMYEKWPEFGKKFDYVIFPESISIHYKICLDSQRQDKLYHLIQSSLDAMKMKGQIRMTSHFQIEKNIDVVRKRIESKYPAKITNVNNYLLVVDKG